MLWPVLELEAYSDKELNDWQNSVLSSQKNQQQNLTQVRHNDVTTVVNTPAYHENSAHKDRDYDHENVKHKDREKHTDTPAEYEVSYVHRNGNYHNNNNDQNNGHNDFYYSKNGEKGSHEDNWADRNATPHKNATGTYSYKEVSHTNKITSAQDYYTHSNTPHDDTPAYHYDNGKGVPPVPHANHSNHNNTGFDHDNYIPSTPEFFTQDLGSTIRGDVPINFISYDKNNDGYGSQDNASKIIKYKLEIRRVKDRNGNASVSSWVTLQDYSTTSKYVLNTIDPLKTGNTDIRATEGYYELRATAKNDPLSGNGVTKEFISGSKITSIRILQDYEPEITVNNGDEFISFTFGKSNVVDNKGNIQDYSKLLYKEANDDQIEGLFVSVSMTDRDIGDYQKANICIKDSSGNKLSKTATEVIWENGSNVIQSNGNVKKGYAFIPKENLVIGDYTNAKVTIEVSDYYDSDCTVTAGATITQQTISKSDTTTLLVNMDVSPPVTKLTPNGGDYKPKYSTTIGVTDNIAGIKDIYYQWTYNDNPIDENNWIKVDNNTLVDCPDLLGKNKLHVKAVDKLQNESILTSNDFWIDNVLPEVDVFNNKDWTPIANVPVTITGSDADSGINRLEYKLDGATTKGWTTYNGSLSITNEGKTNIEVRSVDNAGNYSKVKSSYAQIDLTAPTGTITKDTSAYVNRPVKLTVNAKDELSGVSHIILPDGNIVKGSVANYYANTNNTYEFILVDNVGNSRPISIDIGNIDTTAPEMTLTPNITDITNTDVIIKVTTSDNLSGVDHIILPDGTIVKGPDHNFVVKENGDFTFTVVDVANNSTTQTITISNIDKVPPTAQHKITPDTWINTDVVVNVKADDDYSGVKSITTPDGIEHMGDTVDYTIEVNGDYYFTIKDNANNEYIHKVTVGNIDKTPPTIYMDYPLEWVNTDAVIKGVASDNLSGIDYIILPNGTIIRDTTFEYVVDRVGVYYFTIFDKAGNSTTQFISVLTIDKVAPEIEIINETDWVNAPSVPVRIEAKDPERLLPD